VPVDPGRLTDVPLFAGLAEEERARVASRLEMRHAEPGERICGEGSPGDSFFVIESGTASVTSEGGATRTLAAGDFFGEIALVEDGRRTATVTAASPLDVFVLWGGDFRVLEREQPQVAESIRQAVADRLGSRS
jgi:CRP-like cAMP-binding protein